jgi:hypothetical protein
MELRTRPVHPQIFMRKVFLLIAMAGLTWTAAMPESNVTEIIQRSAQEIIADWNQAPDYSFVERDVESRHGSRASVKTYEVLQIDGSPYERLMAVGDRSLPAAEQAEEDRKLRNEIQKRQLESQQEHTKRVEKYLKERRQDRAMLNGMVEVFDFRLVGEETMEGRDCWVFDANPKPDYQPPNRELKVLAGMRGRLWIDQPTGQWVRVEAKVFQTVSLYGFVAKVRPGTRFLFEQEPVAGSLWLPKHFSTQVSASVFGFINEDSTDDESYSNYTPMPETLSRLGSP